MAISIWMGNASRTMMNRVRLSVPAMSSSYCPISNPTVAENIALIPEMKGLEQGENCL